MIDEELYQRATDELNSDRRRPHLWARACALSSDDHDEARYLYTNLRVEELIAEREAGTLEPAPRADGAARTAPEELGLEPLALDDTADPRESALDDTEPNRPFAPVEPNAVRSISAGSDAPRDGADGHDFELEPEGGFERAADDRFDADPERDSGDGVPSGTSGRDELRLDLDTSAVEFDADEIEPVDTPADPGLAFEYGDGERDEAHGADASTRAGPSAVTARPFDIEPDAPGEPDPHAGADAGATEDMDETADMGTDRHVDALEGADAYRGLDGDLDGDRDGEARRGGPEQAGGRPHGGAHAPDEADRGAAERARLDDAVDQLDEVLEGRGTARHRARPARPAEDGAGASELDALLEDRRRPGTPDVDEERAPETLELVEDDTGPGAKWSVLESDDGALRAVRRGVSWPALAATLPWLLARGLLATALVYAALWIVSLGGAAVTGLAWLEAGREAPDSTVFAFVGFVAIAFFGLVLAPFLRANKWRTDKLARRGWGLAGELRARSADEAIERFRKLDAGRR